MEKGDSEKENGDEVEGSEEKPANTFYATGRYFQGDREHLPMRG